MVEVTAATNENELIAIYDESGERVGVALRGPAHRNGLWHRSVHTWIVRPDGYILFQKRSSTKKVCPNLLDTSSAGHYGLIDTWEEEPTALACVRELQEELGLQVSYTDRIIKAGVVIDVLKRGVTTNREVCDVHFLMENQKPSEYKPGEEVEGLVEMSIADGLRFFSCELPTVYVEGIEWDREREDWVAVHREVAMDDFVPHLDSYYYRVLLCAERLLARVERISV